MNDEEYTFIPKGMCNLIEFDEYECFKVKNKKCSLEDWVYSKKYTSNENYYENDIRYCRRIANKLLIYQILKEKYYEIIMGIKESNLYDINNIYEILKEIGFSNYDREKNKWFFTNIVLADANEYLKNWEDNSNIDISIYSCGHPIFSDGRHRSCVSNTLNIPIKAKIDRVDNNGGCRECHKNTTK